MGRVLPILFNTDMVRAILDGRKTVTRRVVRYKYNNTEMKMRTDKYGTRLIEIQKDIEGETHGKNTDGSTWHKLLPYIEKNPPYKKGDILYVRETYCPNYFDFVAQSGNKHGYKADYDSAILSSDFPEPKWIPSIHMPKEAARIWLTVTDVRAERLRDMDKMDAVKEGIDTRCCVNLAHALTKYKKLWDSTIRRSDTGLYGWKSNPWVWVIEFERCEKPDDI